MSISLLARHDIFLAFSANSWAKKAVKSTNAISQVLTNAKMEMWNLSQNEGTEKDAMRRKRYAHNYSKKQRDSTEKSKEELERVSECHNARNTSDEAREEISSGTTVPMKEEKDNVFGNECNESKESRSNRVEREHTENVGNEEEEREQNGLENEDQAEQREEKWEEEARKEKNEPCEQRELFEEGNASLISSQDNLESNSHTLSQRNETDKENQKECQLASIPGHNREEQEKDSMRGKRVCSLTDSEDKEDECSSDELDLNNTGAEEIEEVKSRVDEGQGFQKDRVTDNIHELKNIAMASETLLGDAEIIESSVMLVQKMWRGNRQRQIYRKMKNSAVLLQSLYRAHQQMKKYKLLGIVQHSHIKVYG